MDRVSSILIVEDNDDDYEACLAALTKDDSLANPIARFITGDEVLEYLTCSGQYEDAELDLPCLILLDLNLPGCDGYDVLAEVKTNPILKSIPVIVMTSSQSEDDIDACYRAGANSFIVKPVKLEGFFNAISMFKQYWFQIALLPAVTL